MELLGYIGATLLLFCSVPQAIKTIRDKDVSSLSLSMLVSWGAGCLGAGIYASFHLHDIPLSINYYFNMCLSALLTYYKVKYGVLK